MRRPPLPNDERGEHLNPVAICIPARDEAVELPKLLTALAAQSAPAGQFVTLCIFLDNCRDDSGALLAESAPAYRWPIHVTRSTRAGSANAGHARGAAMAAGIAMLGDGGGTLLTTDADSDPAPDWLGAMLSALSVADVVAGRILRRQSRPCRLQDRIEAYYDGLYAYRRRLDPVAWEESDAHHQVGGANLGFRAGAYLAAGGFRPQASGEDARIVDDAARLGLRVRRDAASVVHTSDRRTGRAEGGLAHALAALDLRGEGGVKVAHPDDAAWQYRMQARARAAFDAGDPARVASAIGLSAAHAIGVARDCPNSEAFAMCVVPLPPHGMREVSLAAAEQILRARVEPLAQTA